MGDIGKEHGSYGTRRDYTGGNIGIIGCIYMYIYIYICRKRCIHIYIYKYHIYIYIYR